MRRPHSSRNRSKRLGHGTDRETRLSERNFPENPKPGYEVGGLSDEIKKEVGFDCKVVLPPTHDTASAVAAVPTQEEHAIYISSGTWSLMGTELKEADCNKSSMLHNMTNEGGYDYRFRYEKYYGAVDDPVREKESAPDLGFGEICALASKEAITSYVDVNDARFLAPENMTEEVKKPARNPGSRFHRRSENWRQ